MGNEIEVKKGGLSAMMASKFSMDPIQFVQTIKATVMPSTATNEEVAAFLMVAKEYDLNPITREIHAFPKKGGGIQTVVGVDGWAKIITRHPDFNGADFSYNADEQSVTCTIHRKTTDHPVSVTEYLDECQRPSEPWKTMPKRMLRHKAFMQAGRYAFGISGVVDPDEAADFCDVIVTDVKDDVLAPGRHSTRKVKSQVQSQVKTEEAGEVTGEEAVQTEEAKQ
jgi:phage recombination protein Bet